MTEKEYREHPGVNKSTLWEMRKSPAHYKWAVEHQDEQEDTQALRMGRAIHMAVLQPEEFIDHWAVIPEGINRRSNEGKARWAAFEAENAGKEFLSTDEVEQVKAIAKSVMATAGDILVGCETEVPLFWDDPRTGIRCKCRVDAIKKLKDSVIAFDLKTTNDASPKAFARDVVRYGYHVQAAHYMHGIEQSGYSEDLPILWWFVAVEKKPPYATNMVMMSQEFADEGRFLLMELMDKLDDCMRTDTYPGYGQNILELPWKMESGDATES